MEPGHAVRVPVTAEVRPADQGHLLSKLTDMGFSEVASRRALAGTLTFDQAVIRLVEERDHGSDVSVITAPTGSWQWHTGSKWVDYENESSAQLTAAYFSCREEAQLSIGGFRYSVDLEALEQRRADFDGRRRPVRGRVDGIEVLPLSKRGGGVPMRSMTGLMRHDGPLFDAEATAYEWRDGRGWHPYDTSVSSSIAARAKCGEKHVQVSIAGRPYIIDLDQMLQVNPATGGKREIRPAVSDASSPTPGSLWEWCCDEEDPVMWVVYGEKAQVLLEDAFQKRRASASITASTGVKYTVQFADMVQVSTVHNRRRAVRRTQVAKAKMETPKKCVLATVTPRGPTTYQWEVCTDAAWNRVHQDTNLKLESTFGDLLEGVEVEEGSLMLYDFEALEVEDAVSGNRRKLRRRLVGGKLGFEQDVGKEEEVFSQWQALQRAGNEFKDDTFHGAAALWKREPRPGLVERWCRPKEVRGLGPQTILLRSDVKPRDVAQGCIGDCWIVSVLALLAAHPQLLERIVVTKDMQRCCAYIVRLCHAGQWRSILVDDLLPCRADGTLVYVRSQRNQLWPMLVEKACAKLHGSFEALIGGQMFESMGCLTGYVCDTVKLYEKPFSAAWQYVASMLSKGYLLCTAASPKVSSEHAKALGLICGHAYAILRAHEEGGDEGVKLVEIRNPHGCGVWKGDWSDLSQKWNEPNAPRLPHDGVRQNPPSARFWMSFSDFMHWFGTVQYCKVRPPTWSDERMDFALSAPDLLQDRGRIFCFDVQVPMSAEIAVLQVGDRGRACAKGMSDAGWALLRVPHKSSRSSSIRLAGRRYELVTDCARRLHGCVAGEVEMDPGSYALVPLVLCGRRAARPGSGQDRATLVLYTSSKVANARVVDGLPSGAVQRDVALLRAEALGGVTETLATIREHCGQTIIAFNQSWSPLKVKIAAEQSLRVEWSRGSPTTVDVVPSGFAQVLQALTFNVHMPGTSTLKWETEASISSRFSAKEHTPSLVNDLHACVPWPPK